jgi:hypothetical protein
MTSTRGIWKGVVAWSYLVAGLILLPLLVEFVLERVGIVQGPTLEGQLPDGVVLVLMFTALAAGGLALFYWPVAAVVVLCYWKGDRRFALPAVLFLVAHALFFINGWALGLPDSSPLFLVCIASGWVFAIAAVRTWYRWLRGRA